VDAILNWIWQGVVVAIVTTIVLAMIERSRARDRYVTVWVALVSVLALPAVPALWDLVAPSVIVGGAAPSSGAYLLVPATWWTSTAIVLSLWIVWAAVSAVRLVTSGLTVRRVKRASSLVGRDVQSSLPCWAAMTTRGRGARLMVSTHVRSAAVLGFGSPVIAVAPSLFDQLSDDELDGIVIHEWAHVQRWDDVAQIALASIHVVAGWHPAVWWLDRLLRIEREIACDELAVAVTGSAKGYAASLVKLAGLTPHHVAPLSVPAALGSSSLRRRVHRILSIDRRASWRRWRVAAALAGASVCVLAAGVGGIQAIDAATAIVDEPLVAMAMHELSDGARAVHVSEMVVARPTPSPVTQARPLRRRVVPPPVSSDTSVQSSSDVASAAAFHSQTDTTTIQASSIATVFAGRGPRPPTSNGNAASHAEGGPWHDLASSTSAAGTAVGSQSRSAALASASYFTRLGKRIASSF
jgi:bla regulator protein blaR1